MLESVDSDELLDPVNATGNYSTDELRKLTNDETIFILQMCFSVLGILANVIVCIVIICKKSMHTITNCYLFNLSISDMLLLISLSIQDGHLFCDKRKEDCTTEIITYFVSKTSINVSIITVTVFTVERYLAVCHPLYAYATSQIRRSIKILIVTWTISIGCALSKPLLLSISKRIVNEQTHNDVRNFLKHVEDIGSFILYVVPLFAITTMYVLIIIKIRNRKKKFEEKFDTSSDVTQNANLIVMGFIILTIFISWVPIYIAGLLQSNLAANRVHHFALFTVIFKLKRFMFLLSPAVNPIIYSITSTKFREALKQFICEGRKSDNSNKITPV